MTDGALADTAGWVISLEQGWPLPWKPNERKKIKGLCGSLCNISSKLYYAILIDIFTKIKSYYVPQCCDFQFMDKDENPKNISISSV